MTEFLDSNRLCELKKLTLIKKTKIYKNSNKFRRNCGFLEQ